METEVITIPDESTESETENDNTTEVSLMEVTHEEESPAERRSVVAGPEPSPEFAPPVEDDEEIEPPVDRFVPKAKGKGKGKRKGKGSKVDIRSIQSIEEGKSHDSSSTVTELSERHVYETRSSQPVALKESDEEIMEPVEKSSPKQKTKTKGKGKSKRKAKEPKVDVRKLKKVKQKDDEIEEDIPSSPSPASPPKFTKLTIRLSDSEKTVIESPIKEIKKLPESPKFETKEAKSKKSKSQETPSSPTKESPVRTKNSRSAEVTKTDTPPKIKTDTTLQDKTRTDTPSKEKAETDIPSKDKQRKDNKDYNVTVKTSETSVNASNKTSLPFKTETKPKMASFKIPLKTQRSRSPSEDSNTEKGNVSSQEESRPRVRILCYSMNY